MSQGLKPMARTMTTTPGPGEPTAITAELEMYRHTSAPNVKGPLPARAVRGSSIVPEIPDEPGGYLISWTPMAPAPVIGPDPTGPLVMYRTNQPAMQLLLPLPRIGVT